MREQLYGPDAHPDQELLNDYVDGRLRPESRAAVDHHLAACDACRREAEALRTLVASLATLPLDVQPPRDLRPGIAARIDADIGSRTGRVAAQRRGSRAAGAVEERRPEERPLGSLAHRTLRELRVPLAAAAVLLIAGTAALTRYLVLQPYGRGMAPRTMTGAADTAAATPAVHAATTAGPAAEPAALRSALDDYVTAIADLQKTLDAGRDRLSPATVAILRRNLQVIDGAIAESRAALARDPGNAELGDMVLSVYRAKLELLRRARSAVTS
jgi:Putative zinc-finger